MILALAIFCKLVYFTHFIFKRSAERKKRYEKRF